jgi:hypothetical protein
MTADTTGSDADESTTRLAGTELPAGARVPDPFPRFSRMIPAFEMCEFLPDATGIPVETRANVLIGAGVEVERVPMLLDAASESTSRVSLYGRAADGDIDHEYILRAERDGRKYGPLWATRYDGPTRDDEGRMDYEHETELGPVLAVEVPEGTRHVDGGVWPALPGVPPRGTPVTVSYRSDRSGNTVSRTGIVHGAATAPDAEGNKVTAVSVRTDQNQRTYIMAKGVYNATPERTSPPPVEDAVVVSVNLSDKPDLSPDALGPLTQSGREPSHQTRLGPFTDIEAGEQADATTLYDPNA